MRTRRADRAEYGSPVEGRMWELVLPFQAPFVNAARRLTDRHVVLVAIFDGAAVGWGEAAPYPGVTPDTIDDAWASLERGTVLSPTAAAAIDEAGADLEARRDGQPLWAAIGGSQRTLPTSIAVGLGEDPVERIAATGARGVKLKIRPGDDVDRVTAVRRAYPDLSIGVDANGSYQWDEREGLLELDGLGVDYVEQPFAASDLIAHARLREEIVAAVALDEAIDSTGAAIRAIEADACDLIVAKPGRLGLSAARTVHDVALAAGLRIKASGLLETDIGRAYTLAIASLPAAAWSDVAAASWFFDGAVSADEPAVVDGRVVLPEGPGIGMDPNPEVFAPYLVRESVLGSRIWD
jgi:O-succinylbenzoate synthase